MRSGNGKAGHAGTGNDAEWFLDDLGDPGTGVVRRRPQLLQPGRPRERVNGALVATVGQNGDHIMWVRVKDSTGLWGKASGDVFTVNLDGPLASAIQLDPNPTNGTNKPTKVSLDPTWDLDPITAGVQNNPGPGDVVLMGTGMASLPGWDVIDAEWCHVDDVSAGACSNAHAIPMHPDPAADGAGPVVALATMIAKATLGTSPFHEGSNPILVRLHEARPTGTGFQPGRWSAWGFPGAQGKLTIDTVGPATTGVQVHPDPNNGFQGDSGNLGFLDSVKVTANVSDANPGAGGSNIVAAEMFITGTKHGVADPTPLTDSGSPNFAEGTGAEMMAVNGLLGKSNNQDVVGFLPLAEIRAYDEGAVTIWVRGKDDAGQWGPFDFYKMTLDKTVPVIGSASLTPNGGNSYTLNFSANDPGTVATGVVAAEWFVAPCVPADPEISCFNDPGNGNATPVNDGDTITIPPDPGGSPQALWVRVRDAAGNWSDPYQIGPPLP